MNVREIGELRTLLCYGDSNTWGYEPGTGNRYSIRERWTGVMAQRLGESFRIIEEGLSGRTTVCTDPVAEYRNGKLLLTPCLESHKPLDAVIVMLGTNDLKAKFASTAYDIAQGAAVLVSMVQKSGAGVNGGVPKVLLVSPALPAKLSRFAEMFTGSEEKSPQLAGHYRAVAEELGCEFFNAADVIRSSDIDGIHIDLEAHQTLGRALADRVLAMFS